MKKQAFTLAEILITLGIIGIVAAITLTVLVKNYQKTVFKVQYKRSINIISQAMQKVVSELEYIPACQAGISTSDCLMLNQKFINNLKVIKSCKTSAKNEGCIKDILSIGSSVYYNQSYIDNDNDAFILNDGTMIMLSGSGGNSFYIIDTNNTKGPNKWGYDIFELSYNMKKGQFVCSNYYSLQTINDNKGLTCNDLY